MIKNVNFLTVLRSLDVVPVKSMESFSAILKTCWNEKWVQIRKPADLNKLHQAECFAFHPVDGYKEVPLLLAVF